MGPTTKGRTTCVLLMFLWVCTLGSAEGDVLPFDVFDGSDILFRVDFDYEYLGADNASITVGLENPAANYAGASITGIAFNAPDGALTSLDSFTFTGGGGPFSGVLSYDNIGALNAGYFDIGATNAANFENNINGGKPRNGVTTGNSGTFTFFVTGTGLDLLNEGSFLSLTSHTGNGNGGERFAVRWQDSSEGDRSGVAITENGPPGNGDVVPAPPSLLLLCAGLVFEGVRRRLKKSR